ncbi:MAG: PLDc N-terminal domain-containing protein [Clostridia bacterium]
MNFIFNGISFLFASLINVLILCALLFACMVVYVDALKRTSSSSSAIAWALLCFFGFPPLGFIFYYLKVVKEQF